MSSRRWSMIPLLLALLILLQPHAGSLASYGGADARSTEARATFTWSGEVTLDEDYTVAISDVLTIESCTQVEMADGVRINIDGRIVIEGTQACPVVLDAAFGADHWGLRFNSTSAGRASIVENLTIRNADYGISIFGGDADFHDIIIENPDRVGIDIYNSASPQFEGVTILGGGWDEHGGATTWRYGIGISVGNFSTPVFDDVMINGTLTRGINFWGNSGGLYRNITVTNVTGSTLAAAACIWIMDSIPYFEDVSTRRCDTGIWVRQYDDGIRTGAVIRDAVVRDSRFHGVLIDKYDRNNYSNYVEATFEGLEIRGTGGPGATAQGDGIAAIGINVSGAILEDLLIVDNPVPGIIAYLVDSTLYVDNATFIDTGKPAGGAHSASIYVLGSFYAPDFDRLDIRGAPGPGILVERGAATGEGWELHQNAEHGLMIEHATVHAGWINSTDNGLSGAYIHDSSNVRLENLTTTSNGDGASLPIDGSGITFDLSNDVESDGRQVACINCTSIDDALGGIHVKDSIDLYLTDTRVSEPRGDGYGLFVDNSGLSYPGRVNIDGMLLELNRSGPIASLNAAAIIAKLDIRGNAASGLGLAWDGSSASLSSSISNSVIDSQQCATLSNLIAGGRGLTCSGSLSIANSLINLSAFTATNSADVTIHIQDANSLLHLHQPVDIDLSIASIAAGSKIEEAYDLDVWARNQFSNGLPFATIDVDYTSYSTDHSITTDALGHAVMPDHVVREWISGFTGTTSSQDEEVDIGCTYDSTTNSTGVQTFAGDLTLYCDITLTNQAPFIVWATPEDGAVFPSGGDVVFDARESWDLDDDPLSYSWTSSIDGDILSACPGTSPDGNQSIHYTSSSQNQPCFSDGVHEITLVVCDDEGACSNETRTITLTNLPAQVNMTVTPTPDGDGVLRIPRSTVVEFNASGTYDPEGEDLTVLLTDSYHPQVGQPPDEDMSWALSFVDAPEDAVTVTITFDDGVVGNLVTWTLEIILFNELPFSEFDVLRDDDLSQSEVTLDGSASNDPEGDPLQVEWTSSIDGPLAAGNGTQALVFTGHLSAGTHEITLRLTDGLHGDQWAQAMTSVVVENSPPRAVMDSPASGDSNLSSEHVNFSAYGSGDWDSSCDTFEGDMWFCNPDLPSARSDLLLLSWTSDIEGELSPEGNDGWVWEGHLSAGDHIITLSISDGHGDPVETSVEIHIDPSAPVLVLDSPTDEMTLRSNESILFDLRRSVDYDGDEFTWTLADANGPLTAVNGVLLSAGDPSMMQLVQLPKGAHNLTLLLLDETGMSAVETLELNVLPSNPLASITSPSGHYEAATTTFTFDAGDGVHFNAEQSFDADGDISSYEWSYQTVDAATGIPSGTWVRLTGDGIGAEARFFSEPGRYLWRLQVIDELGLVGERIVTAVLESSRPELSDLQAHPGRFDVDVLSELRITVVLSDPDLTTRDVSASVILGEQEWEVILSDDGSGGDAAAGDHVWTGVLIWVPASEGLAALKVTATDSDERFDKISLDPPIQVGEGEFSFVDVLGGGATIALGGIAMMMLASVLVGLLVRRRRARVEHIEDFIEDWGSLAAARPKADHGTALEDELDL